MSGWQRVAGSVLLVGALAVGSWLYHARSSSLTIIAKFEAAPGLYVDNKVSILGMPVGKITKITLRGSYVDVEFTVSQEVKVPAGVQAVAVSTSILTDRHIELTPVYSGGPALGSGDVIGLDRTRIPVEFDRVLAMVDRLTKSLHGDGNGRGPIADILGIGADTVSGNGKSIKSALDELSKALQLSSDGGATTRDQLTTIITNMSSLADAAAKNDANIRQFGSSVHQMSRLLADEELGTGTTGKMLNEILEQAGSLMEKNRSAIKGITANGNTTLQALYDRRREVAEGFDNLPLLLDNLYNIVDPVNHVARAHLLTDKVIFDSQMGKEICNLMGLRQLGCSTGTLQDYGPDFGLTYVLDGLSAMGQK